MSAPRGNQNSRGQPHSSPRGGGGKPKLLKRSPNDRGAGGNLLKAVGRSPGQGATTSEEHSPMSSPGSAFSRPSGQGGPDSYSHDDSPATAFSRPSGYGAPPSSAFNYGQAPSVHGPMRQLPPGAQYRAQQHIQQKMEYIAQNPMFLVEPLPRISPNLKRIVCYIPSGKRLAALVESNDDQVIMRAKAELKGDLVNWDGRSNVPVSKCSLPFLNVHGIEFLPVPHSQFGWAPYYCTLCDYHIPDLTSAADNHLIPHMKEEKRLTERRALSSRLPLMTSSQLAAIERVLVEEAMKECRPDREEKLRSSSMAAIESIRKLCKPSENKPTQVDISLYGSLVSGLLHDKSDINISMKAEGENTKYFIDRVLQAMENDADWADVRICESPTGLARIQAVFNEEKVTVDWQNDDGVRLSLLLSLYNELHEDVIQLREIVRSWAERCDLTTADKLISQHAVPPVLLDIMVIHVLQQSNRVHCLHEIRKKCGKDVVDPNINDDEIVKPVVRWNLAEVFLEFVLYFSKGDAKQFLVEMTCKEKTTKTDTKYSKKHLNIMDPTKDRPIASMHKAFQCYFINCFLTTYVHFRIPRTRNEEGLESKALVDVQVYQHASVSPLKKKTNKSGRKGESKEEEDENDTLGASDSPTPVHSAFDEQQPQVPIVIHGKALEEMLPRDFEIDGELIYSRQSMIDIKKNKLCKMDKELWEVVFNECINSDCLPRDSDEVDNSATPQGTPLATPSSSKRKRKRTKKSKTNKEETTSPVDSQEGEAELLSVGQCVTVALAVDDETQASTSTDHQPVAAEDVVVAASTVESVAPPKGATNPVPKGARRALKLIKLNSAESSELSCDPSPTEDKPITKLVDDLSLKDSTSKSVGFCCEMKNVEKKREKESEDSEEIVLPESSSPKLQATFEELCIELGEFDMKEVTLSLDKLTEDDYEYCFESTILTAGFKCNQHCSACDSPKHLVNDCPQLKVPPVREISRDHWKPYFLDELDRVICTIYDNEKISKCRQRELNKVKDRLFNAIANNLNEPFRLDAFGSSENGFGSNRSDFDVCFRYGVKFDQNKNRAEKQIEAIKEIENSLKYARFDKVMSICSAKVPIVKFSTTVDRNEIDGDISYYNELALHNTRMLKRYCSWTKDEVLSKLGMFIKRWAKQCDIGDASKGSLSSYAYIILLIHFLQRLQPHPLLPVLQEMGDKREIIVDGWDVYFCDEEPKPDWSSCELSVGELFLQFLEYFAKFDWQNQVVQIRKSNKLTKIERGWRKLMCIEDPFDLDHNLGSGISNRMFAFIMKSFVASREVFLSLAERSFFIRQFGGREAESYDQPIDDQFIVRYGMALLGKCHRSVGGAPRDRVCFKCGRIGHFSDACQMANSGFGRRPAGNGGGGDNVRGGGYRGGRGRGGRDATSYRDAKKERLSLNRAAYDAQKAAQIDK